MEIKFSKTPAHMACERLDECARQFDLRAIITSTTRVAIRFKLHYGKQSATVEQHDRVIRALLTLDPDATVRTARAVFNGLQDFEKQRGKA